MAKSILQKTKRCFVCKKTDVLHRHHIYEGHNRHVSEEYGFTVWLCPQHHRECEETDLGRKLKSICQMVYEKTHSREDFIKVIGRNYRS